MIDDPDRHVRSRAWRLAGSLKMKKALPALEARLGKESSGSTGFVRLRGIPLAPGPGERDQGTQGSRRQSSRPVPPPTDPRSLTELEKQAENLENLAKELRKQIEALKPPAK